jgi:uncharacterized protein (TIGR03083 family)
MAAVGSGCKAGAMENDRFLALLRADGDRLADVAGRDLNAAVPSCPGWTVGEAVRHTGSVYRHKIACMSLGRAPEEDEWVQQPAEGEDPVDWFRAGHRDLLTELETRGPDKPSYTWYEPDRTVGFWYRRMAQETAVHRVDVESAFDEMTPVDDELAVDGIDEVLTRFLTDPWGELPPQPAAAGKVVLVRTGDHAWRVTLQPEEVTVTSELGPFDALVSGEPSELLLYLWGRRPLSAVKSEGDPSVLTAFRERLVLTTQ